MAGLTFAPLRRNSALRARVARSSPAGPRRPSRTEPMVPGRATTRRGRRLRGRAPRPAGGACLCFPSVASASAARASQSTPTFLAAEKAGALIASKVAWGSPSAPEGPLTAAAAAAKTGLAVRADESGLKWLSQEYRGRLRVTADGDLVHLFPHGFTKPWEAADARRRLLSAVGRAVAGAARFVVRAWVAIVLVGYAAFFLALVIAMAFARQGNDSRRDGQLPGGAVASAFLRVLGDALFWTF